MFDNAKQYEPSSYTRERADKGELWELKGLATIVAKAREQGMRVYVDFDEGDEAIEEITSKTARMAVCEVDVAYLRFVRDGEHIGAVMVIPSNDEDWLSDYHVSLESLIDPVMGW